MPKSKHNYSKNNIGQVLKSSVESSISSCTLVFGFIVIFSVLIGIIKNTAVFSAVSRLKFLETLILGIIELTNGCNIVILSNFSLETKLVLLSFFTSFSGFCVISQVYAFTSKHEFPFYKYVYRKLIQGVIASCITLILIKATHLSISTFNEHNPSNDMQFSILIVFTCIFLLPFIIYKVFVIIKDF